jgi:hypothetical protein
MTSRERPISAESDAAASLNPMAFNGAGVTASVSGGVATLTIPAAGGGTSDLISEVITSGSAASVTFSSIPSTYRDLIISFVGRTNVAANDDALMLRFNGDAGGNYDYEVAYFGLSTTYDRLAAQSVLRAANVLGSTAPANYAGEVGLRYPTTPRRPSTSS